MFIKKSWSLVQETVHDWLEDKAQRMGAALAYYSIFSLAPLLLIAISVAAVFFGEQAARKELHDQLANTVGALAAEAVEQTLANVHQGGQGVWGTVVGVGILVFGATGAFSELQDSLNDIWKVDPRKSSGLWNIVWDRVVAFGVVFGAGLLLLASLILTTALTGVEQVMGDRLAGVSWVWRVASHVVSFAVVTFLFAMAYKVLPNARIAWRDVWIGALIAALLFTVGKYLIGLYLARGTVASAFGAAGSVIVILVWVYYSSQILLFGAEFAHVSCKHSSSQAAPAEQSVAGTNSSRAEGKDTRTQSRSAG